MHLRYRILLPLLALCTALAVPAFAAKPSPTIEATPSGPPSVMHIGGANSVAAACQMGILGPAFNAFGYILPPDDEYYTYLDPANCGACPGGAYKLSNAHVQLYFEQPCAVQAFISIVGADLSDPLCPRPNKFNVLCPEVGYVLTDGGVLNSCIDYQLPLPAGCCIQGPAFLEIRFENGTPQCPSSRPAFCGPSSCQNCRQFNIYPGAPAGGDDLCAVLSPFSIYGVIMYVDADCCLPDATVPGTWGHLKTLYR